MKEEPFLFFENVKNGVVRIQTKSFSVLFMDGEEETSLVMKTNKMLDGVPEEERNPNWDKAQVFIGSLMDSKF